MIENDCNACKFACGNKKVYNAIRYYLETLYEGCDLTEDIIDEIMDEAPSNKELFNLLNKYKGQNMDKIAPQILLEIKGINREIIGRR